MEASRIGNPGPGRRLMRLGLFLFGILSLWALLARWRLFPPSMFPDPIAVGRALLEELRNGRLAVNAIASLYRVSAGFLLALLMGVPAGLLLGQSGAAQDLLLPLINFCRNLSPLAWIPFAILWLGIGDAPTIFLIFMAAFFPIVFSTMAAVREIPSIFLQVARDYGLAGAQRLIQVTLPAIMPQVITTIRVTAGLAWMVVVAAEMVAGRDGLGFAVWDARNGLRMDLLVADMFVIGAIGIGIDAVLRRLTRIPGVRWGYEQ
jgi:NitT/TauT family transport system permease protein